MLTARANLMAWAAAGPDENPPPTAPQDPPHRALPGLQAQAWSGLLHLARSGRGRELTGDEKTQLSRYYTAHRTARLDLGILQRSLLSLLLRRTAS